MAALPLSCLKRHNGLGKERRTITQNAIARLAANHL